MYIPILCLINIVHIMYNNIGDGDSNVIKRLRLAQPYGPDVIIKKIEYSNHLLVSRVERLRAVIKAVKYRKQQNNISYEDSVKMLKKDIVNSPNHVFGEHENCSDYFCTRKNLGIVIIII